VTPLVVAHAWRSWRNAWAVFTTAAIALAVGIGATTAIFTVVSAVMLRPIGYAHGERFAQLFSATPGKPDSRGSLRLADLLIYRQSAASFDVFGWFKPQSFNLVAAGQPQHVAGAAVTIPLVRELGVPPLVGQWFSDTHGAVISRALFLRLGGATTLVGGTVLLNGVPFTITGVVPDHFRLPVVTPGGENADGDVWIGLDGDGRDLDPNDGFLFSYVRVKPGVSVTSAAAEIVAIAARIARDDPANHPEYTARLDPLNALVGESIRPTLWLLLGAAGVLLLITCANVAALLLARSVARTRDTALRLAIGAGRRRLALQYFVEGLIVSFAGAVAGVALSVGLVRMVLAMAADYIPRADEVGIDWRVAVAAVATAVFASALSSLAPLWQAARVPVAAVLTSGVRATSGQQVRRLSNGLVVGEIALAFALLAISGVLVLHLRAVTRIWPGFNPHDLYTFEVTLPDDLISASDRRVPHQRRIVAALASIPGISHVAFANQAPLDGCCLSTTIYAEGAAGGFVPQQRTAFVPVTPDFFATLSIPLIAGRLLAESDSGREPLPVVINAAAVRAYWPDRRAEGAFGRFGRPDGDRFQVIGVVGDIRNDGLTEPTVPEIYMLSDAAAVNPMRVFVRSARPITDLINEARSAIASVDPSQPIHGMTSYDDVVARSVTLERVGSLMTSVFAVAAVVMATLGAYGVIAYATRLRTVEIGTRMAIGAGRDDVIRMIVGSGLKMAGLGIAIGLVAASAGAWLLTRNFGVHHISAAPFAWAAVSMGGVAAAAACFPAWRISRLSPLVALRDERESLWREARRGVRAAAAGISRAVAGDDRDTVARQSVISEFVDAARATTSSQEALTRAVAALGAALDANWGLLLEPDGPDGARGYRAVASFADVGAAAPVIPAAGFLFARLRFRRLPLPFLAGDLDAIRRWSSERHPERVPEIEALEQAALAIAVPLRTKREILGVLLLGPRHDGLPYAAAAKELLRGTADLLALMLENRRLTDRVLAEEKLRRDVALAVEVQKGLLPERPPTGRGVDLAAMTVAARSVGGDYFDFIEIDEHRLGIAIADVSGKGVAAALIMSVVNASLRVITADPEIAPSDLAARMNGFLHRSTQANKYATFFYATFDARTRTLQYVNAGHNPPYIVRAATEGHAPVIQELAAGGTVIGLFPEMFYRSASIELSPGDVLAMFTDGVSEAMSVAEEEFGEGRLQTLLREVAALPVEEIAARVSAALAAWTAGAPQYDDQTLVIMKVKG